MNDMETFRALPDEPFYCISVDGAPMALPIQLEGQHRNMLRSRFLECPICAEMVNSDATQITCCYTIFCRTCMLNYVRTLRKEDPLENLRCPWCKMQQALTPDEMVDQLQSSAATLKLSEANYHRPLTLFNQLCPKARFKFMSYVTYYLKGVVVQPPSIREPQLRAEIFKECTNNQQRAALRALLEDRTNSLTRIQYWFYTIQKQFDGLFDRNVLQVPTRFGIAGKRYKPVLKSRLLKNSALKLRHRRMRAIKITRSKDLRKLFNEMY